MKQTFLGILSIIFIVFLIAGGFYSYPHYKVWKRGMDGKAKLEKARQDRQIIIEEAKAKKAAAKLNADAELIRAKGMAKSIQVENGKLSPLYVKYLWVRNMENNTNEKIYIPTEAQLPILEVKPKR